MSEEAPITPPNSPEASGELDPSQRYQDVLLAAQNLNQVSTVSTQEAIDEMRALEQSMLYAVPDSEGVLVLNKHGNSYNPADETIGKAATNYQKTIDRIATHGFLDPETDKAYQYTFSTSERSNRSANGEALSSTVRMWLRDGDTTEDTFLKLAGDFGLEERDVEQLKHVAATKQNVEDNPKQGPNFLYRYSAPVLEVGMVKGELKARLGTILTHQTDEGNLVSFEGVDVPTEQALNIIGGGINVYAEQAEAAKASATEAPAVEDLTKEIATKRETSASAFVEQLKKMAPEATALPDDKLLQLVKVTANSSYGQGQAYPDATPAELHVIKIIMDKDASFSGFTKKDDPETLSTDNSELPKFWETHGILSANGRTGLVTRIDVSNRGTAASGPRKELGREEFDAEKSAQLRQQMFEAKTQIKAA